jgi:hypothetical protein
MKVEFSKANQTIYVESPVVLCDCVSLITPRKFKEDSKLKYEIRALFPTKVGEAFYQKIVNLEKQLITSKAFVHAQNITSETHPRAIIIPSVIKRGSDIIAEKKEIDLLNEEAILAKKEKRMYHEGLDYLNDYFYFYARTGSEIKPKIYDVNKNLMEHFEGGDGYFKPSFYGCVKFCIKLVKISDKNHILTAYLGSVQYIKPSTLEYFKPVSSEFTSELDDSFMTGFKEMEQNEIELQETVFEPSKTVIPPKRTVKREIKYSEDVVSEDLETIYSRF